MENFRKYIDESNAAVVSCGILGFRNVDGKIDFLLGKPPNANYWTVFKGVKDTGEDEKSAAVREFEEEALGGVMGSFNGKFINDTPLMGSVGSGKRTKQLKIWIAEVAMEPSAFTPNTNPEHVIKAPGQWFDGQPEIIKIEWFSAEEAINKMPKSQKDFITQAVNIIKK